MRYIQKLAEPFIFSQWKSLANEYWAPSYKELSGQTKQAVYNSLISEQGGLCCYCERELVEDEYHIDHLNPQSRKSGDDLDYENFLCSCLKKTAKGAPLHCGVLKADLCIDVHPLLEDCESKFNFTAIGEIKGINHASTKTIEILGLNIAKLQNLRESAIEPFLSEDLDEETLVRFVQGYLSPGPDGKLKPFCTMIKSVFS